ncbi:MAG TPA: hypothetical protein DDY68_00450 [Porphyromonadaceae bacterium]|nr:hypothetical protein [Porphyromonadaceae bacterium]
MQEEQLLSQFREKVEQLMGVCSALKKKNADLESELSVVREELGQSILKAETFQRKYLNLKAMQSSDAEENEKGNVLRKKVEKLVKEVEDCIRLLRVQE